MGAVCDGEERGAGSRSGHLMALADGRARLQLNLNELEGALESLLLPRREADGNLIVFQIYWDDRLKKSSLLVS